MKVQQVLKMIVVLHAVDFLARYKCGVEVSYVHFLSSCETGS